jgi:hypothetical protein
MQGVVTAEEQISGFSAVSAVSAAALVAPDSAREIMNGKAK